MSDKAFLILLFSLTYLFSSAQENIHPATIKQADSVATCFMSTVFGKHLLNTKIRLNKKESKTPLEKDALGRTLEHTQVVYDFFLGKASVYTLGFDIDDSLQMAYGDLNYDMAILMGWKNVVEQKFTFNYDKLKMYVSKNIVLDSSITAYETSFKHLDLELKYNLKPKSLNKAGSIFIQINYYWLVSISKYTWMQNDKYYAKTSLQELKIDTNTGAIFKDSTEDFSTAR